MESTSTLRIYGDGPTRRTQPGCSQKYVIVRLEKGQLYKHGAAEYRRCLDCEGLWE